jgi:hypothetical protein
MEEVTEALNDKDTDSSRAAQSFLHWQGGQMVVNANSCIFEKDGPRVLCSKDGENGSLKIMRKGGKLVKYLLHN